MTTPRGIVVTKSSKRRCERDRQEMEENCFGLEIALPRKLSAPILVRGVLALARFGPRVQVGSLRSSRPRGTKGQYVRARSRSHGGSGGDSVSDDDDRHSFGRQLDLPQGRERELVRHRDRSYELNGLETEALARVGGRSGSCTRKSSRTYSIPPHEPFSRRLPPDEERPGSDREQPP